MTIKLSQLTFLALLLAVIFAQPRPCVSGQYLDITQTCKACPASCTTCSNDRYCSACIPNFYLTQGTDSFLCQPCNVIFPNCVTCLFNFACTQCAPGYYLDENSCKLCNVKRLSCQRCSQDGNTCFSCTYPFFLVNGTCVSGHVNNIINGSSPVFQSPIPVILPGGIQALPVYDQFGCNQVQVFYFGRCLKQIPNCVIYQENGLCKFCSKDFLVTIFGSCSPKGQILQCQYGFWLNKTADKCQEVDISCDTYFELTGKCFTCATGYMKQGQDCVPNKKCTSQQFFYLGTCIDVPVSCSRFSQKDGTCFECIEGYSLKDGFCSIIPGYNFNKCTAPCATCSDFDKAFCFSCKFGYSLIDGRYGTCRPNIP